MPKIFVVFNNVAVCIVKRKGEERGGEIVVHILSLVVSSIHHRSLVLLPREYNEKRV